MLQNALTPHSEYSVEFRRPLCPLRAAYCLLQGGISHIFKAKHWANAEELIQIFLQDF